MTARAKQYVEFINAHLRGQIAADMLHDTTEVYGIAFDQHDQIIDFETGDECPPLFIVTPFGDISPEQDEAIERAKRAAYAHVYGKEMAQ